MEKILIIDDEKSILDLLHVVFKKEGYQVETFFSASKALEYIDREDFDIVLSDIKLPQISGMEILKHVRKKRPDVPVVMITAFGTIRQAIEALKEGAADYVVKPFDIEELKIIIAQGLEKKRLKQENIFLKEQLQERFGFENIIGESRVMNEIFGLIERIARTDSTVLITGESGTGKEIAARAIHSKSLRVEKPFVTINCGALPEGLLESELFGHVKGSFTGAIANKKGMFEVADHGTLFLDEIGEMTPWTQVKLLRALQEKKIRRVGGTDEISVDVRIIAASNQDLKQNIKEGKFREDLFYRLNVLSLEMPPLRKRKEDIPYLVTHFIQKYCHKMGKRKKRVAPDVIKVFESYPWPGNIRELENVIERTVVIEERGTITQASLPEELLSPKKHIDTDFLFQPEFNLNKTLDEISSNYIRHALKSTDGKLKETSSLLGINYRSLRYMIDKYGLKSSTEDNNIKKEIKER